jgi:hypothetical protein
MSSWTHKNVNKNLFEKAVIDNFRFLQDRYGFSAPASEDFGREIFVRYERANQTVSISYEFGSSPLVEIFYPSEETGAAPIPWATKDGVQRSRRFPKLKLATRFSGDEASMVKHIEEMSVKFEEAESNWLRV